MNFANDIFPILPGFASPTLIVGISRNALSGIDQPVLASELVNDNPFAVRKGRQALIRQQVTDHDQGINVLRHRPDFE
jgi:hypothetical protein